MLFEKLTDMRIMFDQAGGVFIDIAPGAPAELNDQPVEGLVAVNAGDRLCAGGVEVRFITVEP